MPLYLQLADPTEKTRTDTDRNMSAIFDLLKRKKKCKAGTPCVKQDIFCSNSGEYICIVIPGERWESGNKCK
jgi:predicted acetyltransferase